MPNFMGLKRLLLLHYYFPNHFILQKRLLTNTHSQSSSLSSSSSSSSSLSSSSFTVKFLTNSCGLPSEKALSPSQNFQLEQFNSQEHQSLISLLRSFHFSDTQISKLLIKYPQILKRNVNAILKPMLQFLAEYDNGFVGPLLPHLIMKNPTILFSSLSNCIKPKLEFLEKYIHTNDKVVGAVKRSPRLLTINIKKIMQPNIDFLLGQGVTDTTIAKFMVKQPRMLSMKLDRIVKAVETVKELGIKPNAPMFLEATRVVVSLSDSTWGRKLQMFKSFGWSEEEIMCAFKRFPFCFTASEEKIRNLMDFYLNTMNLNPAVILKNPILLNYNLSSRILPRYNVIKVLEAKKLLKEDGSHHWLLTITDEKFLKRIVERHLDQVPNLMELYRGTITGDNIDIQLH